MAPARHHISRASRPPLSVGAAVPLPDGRQLSYRALGPADGNPVLYMHGAIGSPLRRCEQLERLIAAHRIRYIAVERPGFGASTPSSGRTIASFAADAAALIDRLDAERVSVVGVSAGAPYALACAALIPERVRSVAVVSCTPHTRAPHTDPGMSRRLRLALGLLAARPGAARAIGARLCDAATAHPALVQRAVARGAGGGGLGREDANETATRSVLAVLGAGVDGMVDDYLTACRPWGFDPAAIERPVSIWHGAEDRITPSRASRALAAAIGSSSLRIVPGEGHFFMRRRLEEIVTPLLPQPAPPASPSAPRLASVQGRRDIASILDAREAAFAGA